MRAKCPYKNPNRCSSNHIPLQTEMCIMIHDSPVSDWCNAYSNFKSILLKSAWNRTNNFKSKKRNMSSGHTMNEHSDRSTISHEKKKKCRKKNALSVGNPVWNPKNTHIQYFHRFVQRTRRPNCRQASTISNLRWIHVRVFVPAAVAIQSLVRL